MFEKIHNYQSKNEMNIAYFGQVPDSNVVGNLLDLNQWPLCCWCMQLHLLNLSTWHPSSFRIWLSSTFYSKEKMVKSEQLLIYIYRNSSELISTSIWRLASERSSFVKQFPQSSLVNRSPVTGSGYWSSIQWNNPNIGGFCSWPFLWRQLKLSTENNLPVGWLQLAEDSLIFYRPWPT